MDFITLYNNYISSVIQNVLQLFEYHSLLSNAHNLLNIVTKICENVI